MSDATIESSDFLVPLTILILCGAGVAWSGFRWSSAAWPSDETLHCDHTTLTISRIPYLDFRNRTWKTRSYALRDIEKFRFAVYASAKNSSIYGFRFRANGRRHKTLPGLQAPEAWSIMTALQRFGVDAVLDDKLREKADKALGKRGNQISLKPLTSPRTRNYAGPPRPRAHPLHARRTALTATATAGRR
jgi:hypothetical protein